MYFFIPLRGGRKGGSENRKTAQKNVKKPQYRIEIYQNTETAVTNVEHAVIKTLGPPFRSIRNVTLCILIKVYVDVDHRTGNIIYTVLL